MLQNRSLGFKLILLTLSSSALIFAAALNYNFAFVKQMLLDQMKENTKNLSAATINKIETVLQKVEKVPRNLAPQIARHPHDREGLMTMIQDAVRNNAEPFGVCLAYEPYAFSPSDMYFAPYAWRDKKDVKVAVLGADDYNYFQYDWYQLARELGHTVWSEPFYDEGGGNIIMSTFSVPIYKSADEASKSFIAVVTADVSLNWLKAIVSSVRIYRSGYAFLISSNGQFVTHPQPQLIMRESIFSVAESAGDQKLRSIGREMVAGRSGFVHLKKFLDAENVWLYYAPLPSSKWSLGLIIPDNELFADVQRLSWTLGAIGVAGFLLLSLAIGLISGMITRPLRQLAEKTNEISKGNLDVDLPEIGSGDEIGNLTQSFSKMKIALKEYISNLAATTAAKERIESELKIAHTIQMSFLPKRFPPFPEQKAFEIYASIVPALEVGGDLYDFFLLDQDHLFFAIGDVSDKGVPAALFMAVTKTLLKGMAEAGMPPAEVLRRVNYELCQENESGMFVTMFCAVLNFRTGELHYSNGGHNPPVLLRHQQPPQWLPVPSGFVLGGFDSSAYETRVLQLNPGDGLLLYTDGVTEATNGERQLFSDARLLRTLQTHTALSATDLVARIHTAVKDYGSGMPQADDITLLALRFKGGAL